YLRLAMNGQATWQQRQTSHKQSEPQFAFLAHVVSTVPYYRNLFAGTNAVPSLGSFPLMVRDPFYRRGSEFRSIEYLGESENLVAYTNGTIAWKLPVHFDLAGWYDFNYSLFDEVAQARPDVAAETQPGRLGVLLVTDNPYEDRLDVILPSLNA